MYQVTLLPPKWNTKTYTKTLYKMVPCPYRKHSDKKDEVDEKIDG